MESQKEIRRRKFIELGIGTSVVAMSGCLGFLGSGDENEDGSGDGGDGMVTMDEFQDGDLELTSSAFGHNEMIPEKYTADGEDVSPPLSVSEVPDNAETLALIVDDPDAPSDTPFVHWVIWNIPGDTSKISEGVPQEETVSELDGARQGQNDFSSNNIGYRGPAPPSGTHTYQFKLYALDSEIDLEAGAEKEELLDAMEGSMVSKTLLNGEYTRE